MVAADIKSCSVSTLIAVVADTYRRYLRLNQLLTVVDSIIYVRKLIVNQPLLIAL